MTLLLLLRCHVYSVTPPPTVVKGYTASSDALLRSTTTSDAPADSSASSDA